MQVRGTQLNAFLFLLGFLFQKLCRVEKNIFSLISLFLQANALELPFEVRAFAVKQLLLFPQCIKLAF